MKDKIKSVILINNKILPLFKIKNIYDGNTQISIKDINNDTIIMLNNLMAEIKEAFIIKDFNLHKKKDGKISTKRQAFNILKLCLNQLNLNYELNKLGVGCFSNLLS